VAGARNSGILETRLTYIALLDDDDYWLPQKIGDYVKAINQKHGECFYISRGKFVEPSGNVLGIFPSKRFREGVTLSTYLNNNFFMRRRRVSIPTSSYVFPRQGPKGLNLFNEEIFLAEDLLLLLQLDQRMPFQIVGNDALCVTTIYKNSKEGLSRRSIHFDEWLKIQENYFSFLGTRQFANSTLYFGIRHFRASHNLINTLKWYLTNIWKNVDFVTIVSTAGWLVANEFTTLYGVVFRSRAKRKSAKFSVDR
jgi:glycosyltransferase involved in cell wall biosynthesis